MPALSIDHRGIVIMYAVHSVTGRAGTAHGRRQKEEAVEYGACVIPTCPECGGKGVPLLFGLPVQEARDAAADGELALGSAMGCGGSSYSPRAYRNR
jgi:hypothetical protein